jgi:FAD/FMN-containing dehydrogenase
MAMSPQVVDDLRMIVGDGAVITDPELITSQIVDWTGRFRGSTPAVVRPASCDEVARVVARCNEERVAIVPQGGNTGLVGGSIPRHGEIVLDLRRLDTLEPIDARAGQVTAGAGVRLTRLQEHARAAGWQYGVDLSARDNATVGGMVATNAGGVHVLRYGSTRRQVIGVEAVFADGRVIRRLDGLEKDNTGYDLAGLLCGSEGTLAVITAARLRLVNRPRETAVALLAFADIDAAIDAVGELRRRLDSISAIELFVDAGLALVCEQFSLARPFATPAAVYVLVEAAANDDPTDELGAIVSTLAGVSDAAVATDPATARALWRYRDAHTEAINLVGIPHKLDVTLPARNLAAFIRDAEACVHAVAPSAKTWIFGHAGDGNVHVNITGVDPDDESVDDAVFELVAAHNGSISAEHGIGTAKRRWLPLVRSSEEIAAFRAIKDALDPRHILNPHVLLHLGSERSGHTA